MRVIANENVTGTVVRKLRQHGHDVLSVKESMQGADDRSILQRAETDLRLIITQDKDFGELAYRYRLPASCGIVLFRLSGVDSSTDNQRMFDVIESRSDWIGRFSVVTNRRIRMRPLPENKGTT
jgi:predicted nuclease of predicted toxin-antitoxin system